MCGIARFFEGSWTDEDENKVELEKKDSQEEEKEDSK